MTDHNQRRVPFGTLSLKDYQTIMQSHDQQTPAPDVTPARIDAWIAAATTPIDAESVARYPYHLLQSEIDLAVAYMRQGVEAQRVIADLNRWHYEEHLPMRRRLHALETINANLNELIDKLKVERDRAVDEAANYAQATDQAHADAKKAQHDLEVMERQMGRPVGDVWGVFARAETAERERDEARAEVKKLRTWFDALARSSFPAPDQKSGPAKLMGYTLDHVVRILGDFDTATHHLRQRADEGAAERERWKEAHIRAVAEANNLRARAEKAESALAEAQPVLDAVVLAFPDDGDNWEWDEDYNTFLQAYADRRRAQATAEGSAK